MDKEYIIREIKRIADANNGRPPCRQKFQNETGIKTTDWYPIYWLMWGDALEEAGYQRNKFQAAFNENWILDKYIVLLRDLQHFPSSAEVYRKCKSDPSFPNRNSMTFKRLGGKALIARKIVNLLCNKPGHEDIFKFAQ